MLHIVTNGFDTRQRPRQWNSPPWVSFFVSFRSRSRAVKVCTTTMAMLPKRGRRYCVFARSLAPVIAILNTLKDTLENSPTGFKGTETVLEEGLVQYCLAQHEKCLWRIKTPPTCRHRSYRPGAVGSQILRRLYICTADARCMGKTVCSECAIQMTYKCHETDLVVIPSIECQEKLQLTCVDISQEDHVHCSGSYRGIDLGE